MIETPDLAVLGAGPAGLRAALAARGAGLAVVVVDEAPFAGGQGSYRAPPDGSPAHGAVGRRGDRLRRELGESGATVLPGHRVWTASTAPLRLSVAGPGPVKTVQPRALLVAAGATERVMPFPGWTLPGVIGLGAATVLAKTPGPMPAGPVVVAGRGPLLFAAAAGLLARGMTPACVVDEATLQDWSGVAPALLSRPGLLARGVAWLARLRRAGVCVLRGHCVARALGTDALQGVVVRPHAGTKGTERTVAAALLAVGHGLVPSTELLSMLGAALHYRSDEGAWVPEVGPGGRTTVPGLYAAGDGAGIRGAEAAELAGHLAGLAVAEDLGAHPARHPRLAGRLRRADRAGAAMTRLMTPGREQFAAILPATVVCRCEDVTRALIDTVLTAGASDLNQVKARTRCGMGPCQGRVCAPVVAALAALHPHCPQPLRPWTARPPLRPVPIADLVGAFSYAEIPGVKPAI